MNRPALAVADVVRQ